MIKYKKRSENIFSDYEHYLGKERLFGHFFGHKLTANQKKKTGYIWDRLLLEHSK